MKIRTPKTLPTLLKIIDDLERENAWIFRGHQNYEWNLKTSFERMFFETGKNSSFASEMEIALIKKFQREAHYYGIPNCNYLNIPEWLSIMQHYGAPTRLLDWTHSPWVGIFFAIIEKRKDDAEGAALWAINWKKLDENTNSNILNVFKSDNNLIDIKNFIHVLKYGPGIIKLNSYKQNQRQIIQQGTFLFPINIEDSFEVNMNNSLKGKDEIIKIIIPANLRNELIKKLYRMNITYSTLYPGIEGFSMSLKHLHLIEGILSVEENIKLNKYSGFHEKMKAV